MNDEGDIERKERVPAPSADAFVGVLRPNNAIVIGVPVLDVLLYYLSICQRYRGDTSDEAKEEYRLMLMPPSIVVLSGTTGFLVGRSDSSSGGAGVNQLTIFSW